MSITVFVFDDNSLLFKIFENDRYELVLENVQAHRAKNHFFENTAKVVPRSIWILKYSKMRSDNDDPQWEPLEILRISAKVIAREILYVHSM